MKVLIEEIKIFAVGTGDVTILTGKLLRVV